MTNFVVYAILVIGVLAFLHSVYEGILLPSIRLHLRFKLFRLRDTLRALKIQEEGISREQYQLMERAINITIHSLPQIYLSTLVEAAHELRTNNKVAARNDKSMQMLLACKNPDYVAVREQTFKVFMLALVANSGAWLPFLVPIMFLSYCTVKVKESISALLFMPHSEYDKIMGDSDLSFA